MMPKFIFVVGGVMSGVGKGVATASLGALLKSKGFRVSALKIDPYINVDAGTMNPVEHGEVFVTDDGTECDQDLGHYERFVNQSLSKENYMTTGSVYLSVITRERNLEYKGKCVEVVPHIPEEVIWRIKRAQKKDKADIVLVEIGGTVGEYQNLLFLEAGRMMKLQHPKDVLFILITYLPVPHTLGEMKTKPTQNAARTLNAAGIQPDLIVARGEQPLDEPRKRKISIFCGVNPDDVISSPDVDSIYEVPVIFEAEDLDSRIMKKFGMRPRTRDLHSWKELMRSIKDVEKEVSIAIVGKYFDTGDFTLADSYISVIEAVKHASWNTGFRPKISWLSSEKYEKDPSAVEELKEYGGVIVPGGFGSRGVEGKIKAIEYCRTRKIPYFGLCFGLQLAAIEFARNVCGLKNAVSTELLDLHNSKDIDPVIDVMSEQKALLKEKHYGGTMRLGAYACHIAEGTIASRAYGTSEISERHRHRYEFNNAYRDILVKHGLVIAGTNTERDLVEIIELKNHPFFVGVQFHPELKSRPLDPHPLFKEFVRAASVQTR